VLQHGKAASRGNLAAVVALLEGGADPSIKDLDGYTALRLALDRGYGDVADCLNPDGDDSAFAIGRACDTAREMALLCSAKFAEVVHLLDCCMP